MYALRVPLTLQTLAKAVKVLLLRDMATFAQESIVEARDAHGNTPILIAAQQVTDMAC